MAPDGLAPLLDTVLAEAQRDAEARLEEARRRGARLEADGEALARNLEAEADAAGRAEGERARRARVSLAEIEARQQRLAQRAALVRAAIDTAAARFAEELAGPEGGARLGALVRRAAAALGEPKVRVQVRAEDRARLRRARADESDLELELDPEPLGEPGVRVWSLDGRRVVRCGVRELVERREAELAAAAARALFQEAEGP